MCFLYGHRIVHAMFNNISLYTMGDSDGCREESIARIGIHVRGGSGNLKVLRPKP